MARPTLFNEAVELYELLDPRDGEVRYIGKAVDAAKRFKGHLRDSRRRNTPVYAWVRSLAKAGTVPQMRVVATVPAARWQEEERRLIAEARAGGGRLLNLADGGDQPSCSAEVRAANGRANAKAIHSDPDRKALWALKRRVGQHIRDGFINNERRARLRETARALPHLFACFANIPDREENADGSPVQPYRL